MSSDFVDVMKSGVVKIKGKRLGLWKSQWLQLHSASSRGPVRLEKYASQEAAKQSVDDVHKPIPLASLSSLRKLTVDVRRPAIEITFSDPQMSPFMFCPDNNVESDSWYSLLEQVRSSLMQSDDGNNQQSMFHVYLLPTPNLTALGECLMQVTSKEITLYDYCKSGRLITRWPLSSLRRYGREGLKFTIESGRSSPTGEGIFVFSSYQNEIIYQTVHRASTTIAESVRIARMGSLDSAAPPVAQRPPIGRLPSDPSVEEEPRLGRLRGCSFDSATSHRGPLPPLPGK